MLMTVCRRYSRDEAMANDLLQETLIRIFSNISRYKPTGSFEGWMRTIAIRCALQWLEKSSFKREEAVEEFQVEKEPSQKCMTNWEWKLLSNWYKNYPMVFELFSISILSKDITIGRLAKCSISQKVALGHN